MTRSPTPVGFLALTLMLSGLACADASDPAGPGGPVAPEPPPADTVPPPQDLELRADLFLSGL